MNFDNNSIIDFEDKARVAFKFLIYDFGYKELVNSDYANPCSVTYINKKNKVRVVIEGINWGSNARIAFGHVRNDKFQNYDLMDLVSALEFTEYDAEKRKELGQHAQLGFYSELLKNIGNDVLNGNFEICTKIDTIRAARGYQKN